MFVMCFLKMDSILLYWNQKVLLVELEKPSLTSLSYSLLLSLLSSLCWWSLLYYSDGSKSGCVLNIKLVLSWSTESDISPSKLKFQRSSRAALPLSWDANLNEQRAASASSVKCSWCTNAKQLAHHFWRTCYDHFACDILENKIIISNIKGNCSPKTDLWLVFYIFNNREIINQ